MPVYAFYSIPTPRTTQARLAEVGERRASESLKAERFAKELEKNPALRLKMQQEAQQKLEAQRDHAFQEMQFLELSRSNDIASISQRFRDFKNLCA